MPSDPRPDPSLPPPPPMWDARPADVAADGYGGFWLRVVAYIVDTLVLSIPGAILGAVMGAMTSLSPVTPVPDLNGTLLSIAIAWLYFALMESSERGATLGKMAVGLRVVDEGGQRISFLRATGRYFSKFFSALILMIGFIMVAFTDKKRGLHDLIAGTLVVKQR